MQNNWRAEKQDANTSDDTKWNYRMERIGVVRTRSITKNDVLKAHETKLFDHNWNAVDNVNGIN